jgi:hypothetical protein
MTFPTTFANLPAGNQPASLLDTMFSITGAMGAIPCTATGTNAISLTPLTNYYLPGAYANYQVVSFVAANSATGAVTIQLGALAFINLYMPSGLQANSGDITANKFYIAAYNAALNSGNGGFQVFNASTPSVVQPIQGTFKNLIVTNGATPDTQILVTADEIMLQTTGGGSAAVGSINITITTTTRGANGLDAGSMGDASWYAVYVIYNGTTIAGLISLSGTNPTLPSGYIYFARVGWMRTGPSSTNLCRTIQYNRRAQYIPTPSSQTPNLPTMNSGFGGFWTAVAVGNFVPPTASSVQGVVTATWSVSTTVNTWAVAPNSNYGTPAPNLNTSPFPVAGSQLYLSGGTSDLVWSECRPIDLTLETTNIYVGAENLSGTAVILPCLGWNDNL